MTDTTQDKTAGKRGAEHLGFELAEGEGFNRDRVSVFLLLNLVVQSYAEHQMAGFGGNAENLGLAAFLREVTGLFQGRYPEVLRGYGEDEGWSGKPFTSWLRARMVEDAVSDTWRPYLGLASGAYGRRSHRAGPRLLCLEGRCVSRGVCGEQNGR